ncbi:MAG: FAD-dependent monooxygenase [Actinomycetota bacterium]|nr:FAD-dependent monooxygenase [Actinomycetota bacterium]
MTAHRPVLVVGGGPVGLSAALALRAHDIEVAVLEAEPEDRPRPGSRAIYTHRASLELLERTQPGLGREIGRRGLVWSAKRTFWRDREVFTRSYPTPAGDRLPPFTSLPQPEVERCLVEACEASGVELIWNAPVRGLTVRGDAVELVTAAGTTWTAPYVVAADGARSAIRQAIGVPMKGDRSESSYVIVDVAEDPQHHRPLERVFHYEHPAVGRRNVLLVPFPGGWRIDLQCRTDDEPDLLGSEEGARAWVAEVMGERYAQRVIWVSTYRFLQVIACQFTDEDRRVLLVGDAAHLFAPFGARGMNSGIADAHVAADAIHTALRATDPDEAAAAIERFATDRHEAARFNRRAAGSGLAAMQPRGPWPRGRRRIAAALAPRSERAGAWLDAAPYGPRLRGPRPLARIPRRNPARSGY